VLRGHSAAVTALAAVAPGLVASGGADDGLCTWDVAAGALVRLQGRRGREPNAPRFAAARTGPLAGASSGYWALSVPAGGALVALRAARGADVDGTLRMRFLTAGQLEEAAEADFEAELHGPATHMGSPKVGSPKAGSPKSADAAGWEAHHAGSALSARPARPGSPTTAHPTVAAAAAAAVTAAAGAAPRPGYAHAVHSFLALQDGRVAVTSDSPDVVLWDGGAGVVSTRLTGHAERAWAAVEIPARNLLATASWDTTLRLWDLEHDEVAAELKGHTGKVWCLAALGECRLVSGSWDGSVRLWDADVALAGGEACLAVMEGHGCKVWTLCALGEQHAVSGGVDGGLRVWDCAAGVCLHTLASGHTGPIAALAALGGGRVASGGWDGAVRVWDAQLGTPERLLAGHAGKVTALAPLGRGRVASASADGSVRVWDAAGGALLHTLVDHAGWVTHLADLGDGRFASAGADNALRIWDAQTGRCLLVLSACDDETVYAVAAPGRSAATPGRYCFTLPLEGQAIAAVTQLM
jgi:WD40 repeat protein